MISSKLKCLFIHVPKAGGTSIELALVSHWDYRVVIKPTGVLPRDFNSFYMDDVPVLKHAGVKESLEAWPHAADYFKFAVIRNPWERMLSGYFWAENYNKRFKGFIQQDFASYCRQIHAGKLEDFVEHPAGQIGLDQIIRLEDLDDEFPKICSRLGVELPVFKRVNTTAHLRPEHYSKYYEQMPPGFLDEFNEIYKREIEICAEHGYKFEKTS